MANLRLGREQIGNSQVDKQFLKIGSDIECEIVCKERDDRVYELDLFGLNEPGYPTIFHVTMAISRQIYAS
jgi:hypothetical protein